VSRPRHAVLPLVAAAILALSGCGAGEPAPSGPTSAGGLEGPTAWADGVCAGIVELRTAFREIGDDLAINPLAGSGALDEARNRLDSQVAQAQVAVDDLRAEIASAPGDPVSQEARRALDGALDGLDEGQQAAFERARAAAGAETVADAVAAAGAALASVSEAGNAVGDLVATATGTASGASAEVRAVFTAAPTCQALSG
jgi:hypothetical protein